MFYSSVVVKHCLSPSQIQLCCVFTQKRVGEVASNSYLGMLITCLKRSHKVLLDHTMPSVLRLIAVNYTGMNSWENGWHYSSGLFAIKIMERHNIKLIELRPQFLPH